MPWAAALVLSFVAPPCPFIAWVQLRGLDSGVYFTAAVVDSQSINRSPTQLTLLAADPLRAPTGGLLIGPNNFPFRGPRAPGPRGFGRLPDPMLPPGARWDPMAPPGMPGFRPGEMRDQMRQDGWHDVGPPPGPRNDHMFG